ncbi:MAG TPA: hypothetical protein VGG64_26490 [Pirellulales bacterium]|jgi:hypothetical protein
MSEELPTCEPCGPGDNCISRITGEEIARFRFIGKLLWGDKADDIAAVLVNWAEGVRAQTALLEEVLSGSAVPLEFKSDGRRFRAASTESAFGHEHANLYQSCLAENARQHDESRAG